MPDQYTLADFHRRELAPADRPPVMAEIDLISSHHPWVPLPSMVPWDQVGDGSVFDGMPEQGQTSKEVFRDPEAVKRAFGESVEYSWQALTSYLTTYPDPDLVLVVLGDHQPHSYVSGQDAGHDVPVSVIAQDPAVMERIAGWGWQDGLRPSPDAPVWRMDEFRDRFLRGASAATWVDASTALRGAWASSSRGGGSTAARPPSEAAPRCPRSAGAACAPVDPIETPCRAAATGRGYAVVARPRTD